MLDRLLNSALWLIIMGLITGTSGSALILAYRGIFNLCVGKYPVGSIAILLGIVLGGVSYLLCRHCNDLIDR